MNLSFKQDIYAYQHLFQELFFDPTILNICIAKRFIVISSPDSRHVLCHWLLENIIILFSFFYFFLGLFSWCILTAVLCITSPILTLSSQKNDLLHIHFYTSVANNFPCQWHWAIRISVSYYLSWGIRNFLMFI